MGEVNERRLAVFVSFSGAGGVEAGILNLLPVFLDAGVEVDLVAVFKKDMPARCRLDHPNFRLLNLGVRHTHLALPGLIHYLRRNRPAAMLAAKDRAIRIAVLARLLARVDTRLVGQLNTHLSAALSGKTALQRWWRTFPMHGFYRRVDRVVAVSEGVAEDTWALTGLPLGRIPVIRNPVIGPELLELARREVDHPFFQDPRVPIILGAGRLTAQKDFSTLIRAFAKVRSRRNCRLIILGSGPERLPLERLIAELKLTGDVALPGFVANPFRFMAKSALFVLSSRWEGSGNALTEAMALGIPVVATDCPSGPAEMLGRGQFGLLAPVGDYLGLAEAMNKTLDRPPAPEQLQAAVSEYSIEVSANHYLRELGFEPARSS